MQRPSNVVYNRCRTGGYITFVSVLIVGAVGAVITVLLIQMGLGSLQVSYTYQQSVEAWSLAHACAEEGLQQIRSATSFTGSANLTLGNGTCTYTVTNEGGSNRLVTAVGVRGSVVRKAKVVINSINPQILITSWQEVSDF